MCVSTAVVMLTSAVKTEHVEDGHRLLLCSLAVIRTAELQQRLLKLLVAMRHHLAHSLHHFIHPLILAQAGVMEDGGLATCPHGPRTMVDIKTTGVSA